MNDADGEPTSSPHLNKTESGPVALVDELTMESFPTYQASVQLRRIYLPIIIVAGTFGNVVVVVIHSRLPPRQKSSMSVYFTALAMSDTTALWMGWFEMLGTFGVTLSVAHRVNTDYSDAIVDALCRIQIWITYAFTQMSAWILVSMTVHRALGIVWPHRTRKFLTRSNAKKVVVFIVLFCAVFHAHAFYGHSLVAVDSGQTAECYYSFVSERYRMFFDSAWLWVNIVVAAFLPFACLLVTNTVLVRTVGRSLREARETLAEGRSSDQFASRDKKLSSMTVTLVTTSVAFLLLTSPINVHESLEAALAFGTAEDVRLSAESELVGTVCVMLWLTNLAINFYLYCLTGARYRAGFLRLFGCGGSTDRALCHALQSVNTTTKHPPLPSPPPPCATSSWAPKEAGRF